MGTKNFSNANDLITFSRSSAGTALRKIAYGSELVTNGTFDTDTTGWTASNAVLSVVDGELEVANTATSVGIADQEITLEVGKVYSVTGLAEQGTSNTFAVQARGGGTVLSVFSGSSSNQGEFELVFVATNTLTTIRLANTQTGSGLTSYFDNISVKEVLFDQGDLTLFNHPADIPRIEYDADGNVLGLLVEESRTNLLTYSEDFTDASWSKTHVTVTANANDFWELQGVGANPYVRQTLSRVNGTVSIDVSAGSSSYPFLLLLPRNATDAANKGDAYFDLTDGSVVSSNGTGASANISKNPDGSYRISFYVDTSASASTSIEVRIGFGSTSGSQTAVLNDTIKVRRAQFEAGAFPTSYIPTAGATATRSADVASIPVADFGYNQSEGTVVVDINTPLSTGETNYAFALDDGTTTDMAYIYRDASDLLKASTNASGALQGTLTLKTSALGNNKVAYALSTNDSAAVCTGESVQTDATYNLPTVTDLVIGNRGAGSRELNGHIKSIRYYPRRLTNAQLQELTT